MSQQTAKGKSGSSARKHYVHVKNIKKIIAFLVRNGKKHVVLQTANTTKVEAEQDNYIGFASYLKRADLTLVTSVKRHIEKNKITYKKTVRVIDYVTKSMPVIEPGRRIFAIDISAAYWYTARNEGFITEELFEKGLNKKYSKKARLIALGALASQPVLSTFNGKKYTVRQSEKPETAEIFYRCAEVVNQLMQAIKLVLNKDFIFYWVDCVYFYDEKNVATVRAILENYQYKMKIEEIDGFFIDEKNKIVTLMKGEKKPTYQFNRNENDIRGNKKKHAGRTDNGKGVSGNGNEKYLKKHP